MSFNITNQTASPALRGQNAIVTLTWSAANTNMINISVGQRAGIVSNGKLGTVTEVDSAGLTVRIAPAQPDKFFDSNTSPGILAANEVITFF